VVAALSIRPFSRRWIAWKLVQLAARIYDAEYHERITIRDYEGNPVIEWHVVSDLYGCGVSSQHGDTAFGEFAAVCEEFEPDWYE